MHSPRNSWFLGLDLAQRRDFTALATLELRWRNDGRDPVTWAFRWTPMLIVRAIDRYPLGQSYGTYRSHVETRIAEIQSAQYDSRIHLTVDAAGPGAPLVDDFRRARLQTHIHPVTITGGTSPNGGTNGFANVPRRALITQAILLLDHGSLRAQTELPQWPILRDEMLTLGTSDNYSPDAGSHDDLVIALTLAAWQAALENPSLLPQPLRKQVNHIHGMNRLLW